jgi:hypothetical protein
VYANPEKGLDTVLTLPQGALVVGFDHPQASGDYMNRSFLVYCPDGGKPEVSYIPATEATEEDPEGFWIQKENRYWHNAATFFKGRAAQRIFLNGDGYQRKLDLAATYKISDLL